MICTSYGYIHEYAIFDDITECLTECFNVIDSQANNLDRIDHELELRSVLEAGFSNADVIFEAEKESILAKIGNTIIAIIDKVKKFIKHIAETLFGSKKDDEDAEAKLNRILKENPALKQEIIDGLDKEWFTIGDIAKYEKDVLGLTKMLQQNAIDHETFKQRMARSLQSFNESMKPVGTAATTIIILVTFVPKLMGSIVDARKALTNITGALAKINETKEELFLDGASKFRATVGAYQEACGVCIDYIKQQMKKKSMLAKFRDKIINSEFGKKTGLYSRNITKHGKDDMERDLIKKIRDLDSQIKKVTDPLEQDKLTRERNILKEKYDKLTKKG